jgi:hypothetical protein
VSDAQELLAAWRAAASDLRIEVEPFGEAVWVAQYGREAGTVCALLDSDAADEVLADAKRRGMFWSELAPVYLRYDRERFIETLDDWGWFGGGPPPEWYGGYLRH